MKKYILGVLIFLMVATCGTGLFFINKYRSVGASLPKLLAEMEEDGVPTTAEEIAPPMPLDDENAAVILAPAFEYYQKHKANIDADADLLSTTKAPPANHKLSKETKEYLAMSHKAFQRPKMVFERDYSDPINTLFPEFSHLKKLAKLHSLDMRLAAKEGDWARANRDIKTLVAICNRTAEERILIGSLVSIASRAITLAAVGNLFDDAKDAKQVVSLAKYASKNLVEMSFENSLEYESYTCYYFGSMSKPIDVGALVGEEGSVPVIPNNGVGRIIKARMLEKHLEFRKIFRENQDDLLKLRAALREYDKFFEDASPDYALAMILSPIWDSAIEAHMKEKQLRQVLAVAINIHEYKFKNGKYPPVDSELIENELYTEGKLKYVPGQGGFKLYSVGPDGIDHGGEELLSTVEEEVKQTGDVVYTFRARNSQLKYLRNYGPGK
ncbi:MAG: hypothetical protein KDC26_10525 [Armatimonadetes bacterium]|nr:hypothetical protein [Armatimonadota bacterium]